MAPQQLTNLYSLQLLLGTLIWGALVALLFHALREWERRRERNSVKAEVREIAQQLKRAEGQCDRLQQQVEFVFDQVPQMHQELQQCVARNTSATEQYMQQLQDQLGAAADVLAAPAAGAANSGAHGPWRMLRQAATPAPTPPSSGVRATGMYEGQFGCGATRSGASASSSTRIPSTQGFGEVGVSSTHGGLPANAPVPEAAEHIQGGHQLVVFKCSEWKDGCPLTFSTFDDLQVHIVTAHPELVDAELGGTGDRPQADHSAGGEASTILVLLKYQAGPQDTQIELRLARDATVGQLTEAIESATGQVPLVLAGEVGPVYPDRHREAHVVTVFGERAMEQGRAELSMLSFQ